MGAGEDPYGTRTRRARPVRVEHGQDQVGEERACSLLHPSEPLQLRQPLKDAPGQFTRVSDVAQLGDLRVTSRIGLSVIQLAGSPAAGGSRRGWCCRSSVQRTRSTLHGALVVRVPPIRPQGTRFPWTYSHVHMGAARRSLVENNLKRTGYRSSHRYCSPTSRTLPGPCRPRSGGWRVGEMTVSRWATPGQQRRR